MGTNYEHIQNTCPTCGHGDVRHIGKNSCGWRFSFQGYDDVRSWQEWLKILEAGGVIRDEYDRVIPLAEFRQIVESHTPDDLNHYDECGDGWKDAEGYAFSDCDFG